MNLSTKQLFLTGNTLTIKDLFEAASDPTYVITPTTHAYQRMAVNREFAEKIIKRGDKVYGLSTGVGVRKRYQVSSNLMIQFQSRLVNETATGIGSPMDPMVTRGAAIILLNSLCLGRSNVRPTIAQRIANRLSNGIERPLRSIPRHGGMGTGDVTPLAHLIQDLIYLVNGNDITDPNQQPTLLQAGEALPLIAQSSIVTAHAAIAIYEARSLLKQMNVLAALDIEAYAANPSPYDEMVSQVRPYKGYQEASFIIRKHLKGGQLATTPNNKQRHLQSPLTFRSATSMLGAAYDCLHYCESQINIELNAHQQNPLSLMEKDCMVSNGNFDMQPIAQAMDFCKLALAPCLTAQNERSIKLLQKRDNGLTDGLMYRGEDGATGHGMSGLAWTLQNIATEARLVAVQAISAEIGSSNQAESVEDRCTMAGLGARKVRLFVQLALKVVALSTVIACQAIDVRDTKLNEALTDVYGRVRKIVPVMKVGDPPPIKYVNELIDLLQVQSEILCNTEHLDAGVSKL